MQEQVSPPLDHRAMSKATYLATLSTARHVDKSKLLGGELVREKLLSGERAEGLRGMYRRVRAEDAGMGESSGRRAEGLYETRLWPASRAQNLILLIARV